MPKTAVRQDTVMRLLDQTGALGLFTLEIFKRFWRRPFEGS